MSTNPTNEGAPQGYAGYCPVPGCGKAREQENYFCRSCYHRLPEAIQKSLYTKTPKSPHENYRVALRILVEREVRATVTDTASLLPGVHGRRAVTRNPGQR